MQGEMDGRAETGKVIGGDIEGFRCCKRVAGGWSQCDTLGERVDGISAHDAVEGGEDAIFYVGGINRVVSGAALVDAEEVVTSAAGKLVPVPSEAGDYFVAGLAEGAVSGANLSTLCRHWPGIHPVTVAE